MIPSCVRPKVRQCRICKSAGKASDGSCAVSVQRTTPASAPIITIIAGDSVNRGDRANTTISATTPIPHSAAMVRPLKPAACQVIEPKP